LFHENYYSVFFLSQQGVIFVNGLIKYKERPTIEEGYRLIIYLIFSFESYNPEMVATNIEIDKAMLKIITAIIFCLSLACHQHPNP
jgi:hypothetical protein